MAVQLQACAPTLTAMVVKEAFAKHRSETMTTDASSGYATDDSTDMGYETPCSASSPQSRNREQISDSDKKQACSVSPSRSKMASDSVSSLEISQEISRVFNETSAPAPVVPKTSVALTIPGITKSHPRSIFTIDLPKQHKEAHTNMQIAPALTPVSSPTASGRRTQAWRRQRHGSAKDASDPVHELLKVASRRLFKLAPAPQKRDCVGPSEGFGRSLTSAPSFLPAMDTTCVVTQPPSTQFGIQTITCEPMIAKNCSHATAQSPEDRLACAVAQPPSTQFDILAIRQHVFARHCSHAAIQNPVHKFAWRPQMGRNSGSEQETPEPCGVPRQSRSLKHDVPMKIITLSTANDRVADLNPLEPLYRKVSAHLTEDTFGKALLQLRRELIPPPPGLGSQSEEKQLSKKQPRTRTRRVHDDVFEDSRKNEV